LTALAENKLEVKERSKSKKNKLGFALSAGPMEQKLFFLQLETETAPVFETSSVEETPNHGECPK
jgi:hypothetical protein